MMGEYIIYYRDRIVGGIYDDRLLVKPTKSAVSYMANATYELPYEGAKEMLLPCRFVLYCFILLFSRRYYICTILHSTFQQKFISERIQFRAYQSLRHMVVKIETVRKGVEICKNEGIDMVLAIGGGSTIDCSKVVAAGTRYDGDVWDLVLDGSKVKAALPIFDVLTLSATGTEMDPFAVISDMSKNEKWGTGSPYMVPTMSILNPEYTFSVSKKQTAAGTADMMSHTMENYFSMENADCQKFMAEGLLRTMIKNGPVALAQPDNYDARANLMWAGTHAINGVVGDGCSPAWCVHPMEHELSAFYDITHGEGLAILTPAWMEHILNDDTLPMFVEFAKNVWGLSGDDEYALAHAGIDALKKFFFETMGIPANLRAVGITDDRNFEVMAKKACDGSKGSFVPLSKDDIVEIYRAAF